MTRLRHAALAALTALAAVGCRSGGEAGCVDFVDTYADWLVECGVYTDRRAAVDDVLAEIEMFSPSVEDCSDIVRLRDADEFYDECLPQIESQPCSATTLPPACNRQLLFEE